MYQGQGWLWVVGFSPYNNLNCEGTQVMVWNHLHSAKLSTLLQNIFHTTSSTRWYVKKKNYYLAENQAQIIQLFSEMGV